MLGVLEPYSQRFARLRTDASPSRWTALTYHRAPHKPLLLLALLDLIAQEVVQNNFVTLSVELIDTFALYWSKVMDQERLGNPVLPFYHLHSETWWELLAVPGKEEQLRNVRQIRSMAQARECLLGAKLAEPLFAFLTQEEHREALREVLIETYFAPEVRPKLFKVSTIARESFAYSRELLKRMRTPFAVTAPMRRQRFQSESRSFAFRRLVVQAYNQTCAVCQVRVVSPEGYTAVAAAHIVPWSMSHNDDPRNGLALCGLHHWTFDYGMVGVRPDYRIAVSPLVLQEGMPPEIWQALDGRRLYMPADEAHYPAPGALEWHWKQVFRMKQP